jgi:hypothetical protein
MSLDKFNEILQEAYEKSIEANRANDNSTFLTKEIAREMISKIEGCQYVLSGLLKQTADIGGFCNYYVKDALKNLDIMRKILEMEIKGEE